MASIVNRQNAVPECVRILEGPKVREKIWVGRQRKLPLSALAVCDRVLPKVTLDLALGVAGTIYGPDSALFQIFREDLAK